MPSNAFLTDCKTAGGLGVFYFSYIFAVYLLVSSHIGI